MDREKRRKRSIAFFLVAIVLIFWNLIQNMSQQQLIKIACVGDSITFGSGLKDREQECYPVQLLNLLGTKQYRVGNFGVSGAAIQKSGKKPYWKEDRFSQSLSYEADLVVLLLGTNDTTTVNWKGADVFRSDYEAFLKEYETLSPAPSLLLCTLPKIHPAAEGKNPKSIFQEDALLTANQIIQEIAAEKSLPLIDLYTLTADHPEWFAKDGLHPNAKGASQIAQAVYDQIVSLTEK